MDEFELCTMFVESIATVEVVARPVWRASMAALSERFGTQVADSA
jgi:hypothetical protein